MEMMTLLPVQHLYNLCRFEQSRFARNSLFQLKQERSSMESLVSIFADSAYLEKCHEVLRDEYVFENIRKNEAEEFKPVEQVMEGRETYMLPEIWLMIFDFLDAPGLQQLSLVNRWFNILVGPSEVSKQRVSEFVRRSSRRFVEIQRMNEEILAVECWRIRRLFNCLCLYGR